MTIVIMHHTARNVLMTMLSLSVNGRAYRSELTHRTFFLRVSNLITRSPQFQEISWLTVEAYQIDLLSSFGLANANPNVSFTIQFPFDDLSTGMAYSSRFDSETSGASSSGAGPSVVTKTHRHNLIPLDAPIPAAQPEQLPERAAALKCAVCLSYAAEGTPLD